MLTEREARQYSPLALAFLGDSVYEQLVRESLLMEGNTTSEKLHTSATKRVCAAFQSAAVEVILPVLTEDEISVLKRGRNATGSSVSKSASIAEYRRATSLECLFGYLHLIGNKTRTDELFSLIWQAAPSIISGGKTCDNG